jgi:hypothetical protein
LGLRLAAGYSDDRKAADYTQPSSHRTMRDASNNAVAGFRFASHCGVGALQRLRGFAAENAVSNQWRKGPAQRGPSRLIPD